MNEGYEVYCLVDPVFYDSPLRGRDPDFETAQRPVPEGWERHELDDWLVYHPGERQLPMQGWKIHASASLEEAEAIAAVVFDYCVSKRVAFKFVRNQSYVLLRNSKYADRGSSGKFATIYPVDEAELEVILNELGQLLNGRAGPYILSDLRWGDGPLYVRYGGFAERYCVDGDGRQVLAIEAADGRLIPDTRGPTFEVPPWIELPRCLLPHLAARNKTTLEEIPYRIDEAIHFSNGGGLYAGVDTRTNQKVVLKEARPFAGLATDGEDAVSRQRRERDILERLAGLEGVPSLLDSFTLGEHHFLVEEFVDGTTLDTLFAQRYPLVSWEPDDRTIAEYTAWALGILDRVEQAVAGVHGRGVVLGDLHPNNVLVRADESIVLIDFEIASDVSEGRRPTMADPGFLSPRDRIGFDIDLYALGCLRLFLFLPLPTLVSFAPGKAEDFVEVISAQFPLPSDYGAETLRLLGGPAPQDGSPPVRPGPAIEPDAVGWSAARASMARAIVASASPTRDDRLFPGDPAQFETGGLDLAYGAAGVLYALGVTGAGRFPEYEDWLVHRATNPQMGTRFGFYDGLPGVAYVLDRLGRRDDAIKVLDICTDELGTKWDQLGLDLASGLAGLGLTLAYFAAATGDPSCSDLVDLITDIVADRLGDVDSVAEISGGDEPYAGLFRGSSGPALFFVRLYEQTGDDRLLDLAGTALRQDLRRCQLQDDGILAVDEGWRTMPYLADGSAGIGVVIDDYLTHRQDEQFAEAGRAIRKAAEARFYIEPTLFYGRAGMILYLARKQDVTGTVDPFVTSHVRNLRWHALSWQGSLAYPGDQLLRVSMDLATGTAGVLLAVGSALQGAPAQLPFLVPIETEVDELSVRQVFTAKGGEEQWQSSICRA